MKDKRQIIISTCLVVMLILAIVGISYAAFSYIGKGSTVNQITTGTISMNYEESSNVIKITNALPTRDETGKVRLVEGEYFDFSVTTNISGNAVINFEIAVEELADNTFDGSNVKFYLTKLVGDQEVPVNELLPRVYSEETLENDSTGRPAGMMSLLIGSVSTIGKETTNYRLRLYVDENYNPQGDGGGLIFRSRINVYGKLSADEVFVKPIMRAYTADSTEDYHATEYKSKVTSIVMKTDTNIPSTAVESWDVSEAGDESVIAYAESDGSTGYKITIGGKNGVLANPDSSFLFHNFVGLNAIDLSSFNTSNATKMYGFFANCSSLINLDLSGFDTSNVTDMISMFYYCKRLQSLNLSNFDTSSVTKMDCIFEGCSSLTNLDVSSFNTARVTSMWGMFTNCSNLMSLDVTSFNTSNVMSMYRMFAGCKGLSVLDLTAFDISKVTNIEGMFLECSSLMSLDLRSFNTSNVTNMLGLFQGCNQLTSILVSKQWTTVNAITTQMFLGCGTNKVTIV